MFIDTEDAHILRQHRLEHSEAALSHKTEAGVVCPTLGVIPVRDHNRIQPEMTHNIEAFRPMRLLTDLVYLVYGQGKTPDRERRRAGSNKACSSFDPPFEY